MIKKIYKLIKCILKIEMEGFYYLFLIISRGFFLIINIPFILLNKIIKSEKIKGIIKTINKLQEKPVITLVITILFSSFILYEIYIYIPEDKPVKIADDIQTDIIKTNAKEEPEEEKEEEITNLYRKYSSYKINDINFANLKEINSDIVSWLIVDGTNINYPIVQTKDNSYYLNHDFNKMSTINGWTFIDYRNNPNMNDNNTIFYGHNLYNKTAFGSISNLFSNKWYNESNHKIIVLTESSKYEYEIFSLYYSEADSSYLRTNYESSEKYQEFLNSIKEKSVKNFSVDVTSNDRIITLSTCTDDNNGRKVVHAKLMKSL